MRRLRIRKLMILVALIAVILGLSFPAIEVYQAKEHHVHTGISVSGRPTLTVQSIEAPFWPRYLRRLIGQPWRREPLCRPTPGFDTEICEFAQPDIRMSVSGRDAYRFTSAQAQRIAEIQAETVREAARPSSDGQAPSGGGGRP